MARLKALVPAFVDSRILTIRGEKVMLDADLAVVYDIATKVLNQAVRRNRERFPPDFRFQLTKAERAEVVTNCDHLRGLRFSTVRPWVFTEHGALMAASVLNSPRAVQMSVFVVRAFVKMRGVFADTRDLARKLAALEQELKGRLDVHEATIVTILQRVMDILDPSPAPLPPKPRRIGFRATSPPA